MKLIETLRRRLQKRADYYRTLRELRAMPGVVARDLGIDRRSCRTIARRAVYGA